MNKGFRIITPGKKFDQLSKTLQTALDDALDESSWRIQELLTRPTRTWKHKVVFVVLRQPGKRIIETNDAPYKFVSRGTRVRYAVMSPNFVPKTRVRSLNSGVGAGGVVFIGRKPLPGIKAREFEEEARDIEMKRVAATFNLKLQNTLDKFNKGFPRT